MAAALALSALFPGTRALTASDRVAVGQASATYLTGQARRLTASANPANDFRAADVRVTVRHLHGTHDEATATVHEVTSLWFARPDPDGPSTTGYAADWTVRLHRGDHGWRVTSASPPRGQRAPAIPGADPAPDAAPDAAPEPRADAAPDAGATTRPSA